MFRTALIMAGHRVVEAADGMEALQLLDRNPPDLVVLDLRLPRVSGGEVRQEIASQAHTRDIPIVVVTATPGPHDELGVACVLTKPIYPDVLVEVVRDCLKKGTGRGRL